MRRIIPVAVAALVALGFFAYSQFSAPALAGSGAVFEGQTPGIAINGYDAVAYFTAKAPVKGSADHSFEWNGSAWHFANGDNKAKFAADPAAFAPQYGGFCAYAAAKDQLAKTEPDAFTVYDGKLYLNFNQSVKSLWDGNRDPFIETGDANWPDLEKQAAAQ